MGVVFTVQTSEFVDGDANVIGLTVQSLFPHHDSHTPPSPPLLSLPLCLPRSRVQQQLPQEPAGVLYGPPQHVGQVDAMVPHPIRL